MTLQFPDQLISLERAIEMTTLYRNQKDNILKEEYKGLDILALSETFDRSYIEAVLGQAGCTAVRIYSGMSEDLKIHSIIVGVNDKNEDILPASGKVSTGDIVMNTPPIVESGIRCPPSCPNSTPL